MVKHITKNEKEITGSKTMRESVYKIAVTGLMAALSYVAFAFLGIPFGGAKFHLGNAATVLAALLLGPVLGGLSGSIGMTIADLTTGYVTSAPKTFILKFCIGLITGLVAHKIGHISTSENKAHVAKWTVISSISGLLFNAIFDPFFGYWYKRLILQKDAASLVLKYDIVTSGTNAIISTIAAVVIYLAIRPILKKTGLFITVGDKSK